MTITKGIISQIEKSPSGLVSYVFFTLEEQFEFKEGQFVMLESLDPRCKLKRAYSIATTNVFLKNTWQIGIIIKKTSEDGMSNYLTQLISVGDDIKITWPLGHFVDKLDNVPNVLLVSIGSGITPILSIYQHLLDSWHQRKICNLFGERENGHLLTSIVDLFNIERENVKNLIYLSQQETLDSKFWTLNSRSGRIQAGIDEALEFVGRENTKVFICGKPEMVDDVRKILEEKGIVKERIVFEKY